MVLFKVVELLTIWIVAAVFPCSYPQSKLEKVIQVYQRWCDCYCNDFPIFQCTVEYEIDTNEDKKMLGLLKHVRLSNKNKSATTFKDMLNDLNLGTFNPKIHCFPVILECLKDNCDLCNAQLHKIHYPSEMPPFAVCYTKDGCMPALFLAKKCAECKSLYYYGHSRHKQPQHHHWEWDHPKKLKYLIISRETAFCVDFLHAICSGYAIGSKSFARQTKEWMCSAYSRNK